MSIMPNGERINLIADLNFVSPGNTRSEINTLNIYSMVNIPIENSSKIFKNFRVL